MKLSDVKPGQRVEFPRYVEWLELQHGPIPDNQQHTIPGPKLFWRVDRVIGDRVMVCHWSMLQTLWFAVVDPEWLVLAHDPVDNPFEWHVIIGGLPDGYQEN